MRKSSNLANPIVRFYALTLIQKLHLKRKIQRALKSGECEAYHMCECLGIALSDRLMTEIDGDITDLYLAGNLDFEDTDMEANGRDFPKSATLCYGQIVEQSKKDPAFFCEENLPGYLHKNLQLLQKLIPLNEVERGILIFVYLMHFDLSLNSCAKLIRSASSGLCISVLSTVLNKPKDEITQALLDDSLLVKSGLIELEFGKYHGLSDSIKPLSDRFLRNFIDNPNIHDDVFRTEWTTAPKSTLSWSDYGHLEPLITGLKSFVKTATARQGVGGNILLYGPPGTGKTELSRLLGDCLNTPVYEVTSKDRNGSMGSPIGRLNSLRSAQTVLQNQSAILVFDEIEDVFGPKDSVFGRLNKADKSPSKAWLNKTLEDPKVLTIWISNQAESIDRAYIRRFDLVLKMPIPPISIRERQITQLLGKQISRDAVSKIAHHPSVSPAMLTRTAKVLSMIGTSFEDQSALCTAIIDQNLMAQSFAKTRPSTALEKAREYRADLVNCSTDLQNLSRMLKDQPSTRILVYGPPGTGKTAFGHWLAMKLEKPLLMKRASDLLGKYIGENEQNIANAFEEAFCSQSILLIDEIDSFVQSRSTAVRAWEISMVNEMLTQMENFEGLFIASTNFDQQLDSAIFRRFDLKMKFDYLSKDQLTLLVTEQLGKIEMLGKDELNLTAEKVFETLGTIHKCTPGDVAAVIRQHRFKPILSLSDFVGRLQLDLKLRHQDSRSIGFLTG